jgi:hypothetical protein
LSGNFAASSAVMQLAGHFFAHIPQPIHLSVLMMKRKSFARTSNTNVCNNTNKNASEKKRTLQHLGIFFQSLRLTNAKHGELYGIRIKITKKTTGSAAPVKSKYNRDNLNFLDGCLQERR